MRLTGVKNLNWLVSALRLLGIGAGVNLGTSLVESATGINVPGLGTSTRRNPVTGIVEVVRRRRRRRALTQSDKLDIAFVSGTLGRAAGEKFAMIIAARVA